MDQSSESLLIPKPTGRDIWRFAWHYWSQKPKFGILAFLFLGISVSMDIFFPVYTGKAVDYIARLNPDHTGDLGILLGSFGIIIALQFGHSWLWSLGFYCWNKFTNHVLHSILTDTTRKVLRFSTDWHANSFAGSTVRKITRGMGSFDIFEDVIFMGLFPATIIGIGMMIMLIINIPLVGLVMLPFVILYILASIIMVMKIGLPRHQDAAAIDTQVGASLADIITGVPTVKSFGNERREDEAFHNVTSKWQKIALRAWQTSVGLDFIRSNIRNILMAAMFAGITILWSKHAITPGEITMAITAFFIISGYLREIGRQVSDLSKAVSEISDAVGFWLREDDIQDHAEARELRVMQQNDDHFVPNRMGAEIRFDNVGFAYKEGERKIYDHLSITIPAGEKVALVGASGSGKSTFVKLIQRLYDVQNGEILIDGQNIARVTQESLRKSIALVPQDPILFHRSLAENIAYGRPNATLDEVRLAAQESYAAEFIENLPLGYQTLVGERGIKLSGGERQRVAIARALLADCPILILDEATSSLDSVSEHYIQKALERLMEGRTTITIAHRLATIQNADRILVFDRGRIVEQGKHAELLENPESIYRKLYEIQALGITA